MQDYILTDDYGRKTTFTASQLTQESTDNLDGSKPQWTELTVWRTEAGQYVVRRCVNYRVRHLDSLCPRAHRDGVALRVARISDSFPCSNCNPSASKGGFGQVSRTGIEVYATAGSLISGLTTPNQNGGPPRHSDFAQSVLSDISEQDDAVAAEWLVHHVE